MTGVLRVGAGDVLLVVDVQRDFLPGGSLPVPHGDAVIDALNGYLALWRERGLVVVATRDWHPADHCSFRAQGGPWPPHCVADTPGAAFGAGLALPLETLVVSKATCAEREAYSAFEGTDLDAWLRAAGARRLFAGGLATDYCVRRTVEDALGRGWWTGLLTDAVRAVDVEPGDGARAIAAMLARGAVALDRTRLA